MGLEVHALLAHWGLAYLLYLLLGPSVPWKLYAGSVWVFDLPAQQFCDLVGFGYRFEFVKLGLLDLIVDYAAYIIVSGCTWYPVLLVLCGFFLRAYQGRLGRSHGAA